ncbi:hypothetical protein D918_07841 [Trichuris suis]|nr:hypothetical protein D918_07841 [Trichuris suis]
MKLPAELQLAKHGTMQETALFHVLQVAILRGDQTISSIDKSLGMSTRRLKSLPLEATDQCFARPLFLQFTAKLFKQACRSFFFRFSTNLWLNEGLRMGSLLHWVCCHFAPKSAFEYGIPEHNKSAVFTFFKEAFDKADR